jgi:hypothetical protein
LPFLTSKTQATLDIRAVAGSAFQAPFGVQLFERHHGGAARHIALPGELARESTYTRAVGLV